MQGNPPKHLLIGLASDVGGFLRWQCPHCGLDFKLKGAVEAQQDALGWWIQASIGQVEETAESDALPLAELCCPYCTHIEAKQRFAHPETVSYIRRIARREIVEPMVKEMLSGFGSKLKSSKHVRVTVSQPAVRSTRPISGPEPNDMVAVSCLACGGVFKVDEGWRGTVRCCLCRRDLLPQ